MELNGTRSKAESGLYALVSSNTEGEGPFCVVNLQPSPGQMSTSDCKAAALHMTKGDPVLRIQ